MIQDAASSRDYVDLSPEELEKFGNIVPKEVCHFTSKHNALKKILKHGTIRFNDITSTNDPKETKERLYYFDELGSTNRFNPKGVVIPLDLSVNIKEKYRGLIKECRIFCTSCHNDLMSLVIGDNSIQICYGGMGRSSMWTHYAKNHSGVCLLFDGKKLDENINEKFRGGDYVVRHGLVTYDFDRSFAPTRVYDLEYEKYGESERKRQSLIKHYKNNFLCKTPDWKSEHEFRWLVFNQSNSEMLVPIENAIKSVVVGTDYKYHFPCLNALCKPLKIPVGKMNWLDGRPQIEWF